MTRTSSITGLSIVALFVAGCAAGGPADPSAEISELARSGEATADECEANGFNTDGVCDWFCADSDPVCRVLPPLTAAGGACAEPSPEREDWHHRGSRALAALGHPHHGANDVVLNPGQGGLLEAKFVYGFAHKDLEDEDVMAFIHPVGGCNDWTNLGRATTNSDGVARFGVDALSPFAQPGKYEFQVVALGDGTRALGTIHVIPFNTPAVVFDIDGTLTTNDGQLLEELILGLDADMWPDANTMAQRFASAGYFMIYTTGRERTIHDTTRRWLAAHGLPPGALIGVTTPSEGFPSQSGIGTYKAMVLNRLKHDHLVDIRYAFGNASTDICAYANAGIAISRTYIIGPNAGHACDGFAPTNAVSSYTALQSMLIICPLTATTCDAPPPPPPETMTPPATTPTPPPSEDPCAFATACDWCTAFAGCGWCPGTSSCRQGTSTGPLAGGPCADWAWGMSQCGG